MSSNQDIKFIRVVYVITLLLMLGGLALIFIPVESTEISKAVQNRDYIEKSVKNTNPDAPDIDRSASLIPYLIGRYKRTNTPNWGHIEISNQNETLFLRADAIWGSTIENIEAGNVHLADIEGPLEQIGYNKFLFILKESPDDCRLTLQMSDSGLLVYDAYDGCGGARVSFTGAYEHEWTQAIVMEDLKYGLRKRINIDKSSYTSQGEGVTTLATTSLFRYLDNVITAKIRVTEYYEGAAHPNNSYIIKNYDSITGEEVGLDKFIPNDSDRQKLSKRVYEYLKADPDVDKDKNGELYIKDLSPDEMLKNFVVTEDVIYFYFSGVAPHAAGEQVVPVVIESIDGWSMR